MLIAVLQHIEDAGTAGLPGLPADLHHAKRAQHRLHHPVHRLLCSPHRVPRAGLHPPLLRPPGQDDL